MTDIVADGHETEDWVGFLILVVAPNSFMAPVTDAVHDVERTIFGDPVLVDMARVAVPEAPDPLDGDLDAVASGLHRDLVAWARSPARNPAPRFTFCVLVVHDDVEEADRLVRSLAATGVLSELPIIFRIGEVTATPDEDTEPETDRSAAIVRMIHEAIDATAHEVDRTPTFCLTKGQLTLLGRRRRARPTPTPIPASWPNVPEPVPAPPPAPPPDDDADTSPAPDHGMPPESGPPEPPTADPPVEHSDWEIRLDAKPAAGTRLRSVGKAIRGRIKVRRSQPALPAGIVDVIDDLSARTDQVSMLYLVFVSGPVRPPQQQRMVRAEVATTLARALLTDPMADHGLWYVRTFTADRKLHPGSPLPEPEHLGHKNFPDRWGEHFDLYDVVGHITESVDRDRSSFERRGARPSRAVVLFLGSPPRTNSEDQALRLAHLCTIAETIWISFDHDASVPGNLTAVGAHFLRHHEDVSDQLLRLITDRSADQNPPRHAEGSLADVAKN